MNKELDKGLRLLKQAERCECCGEGKDAVAETETAWQCNDCEQWNEGED